MVLNISNTKGALSKLTFGGDKVNSWDSEAPEPAVLEVGMAEADLSNKGLKAGGAIIVGAWISHKDDGAMTTVTFGDMQAVTMKADMTEADLSGKQLDASGAIIAAVFLPKCQ